MSPDRLRSSPDQASVPLNNTQPLGGADPVVDGASESVVPLPDLPPTDGTFTDQNPNTGPPLHSTTSEEQWNNHNSRLLTQPRLSALLSNSDILRNEPITEEYWIEQQAEFLSLNSERRPKDLPHIKNQNALEEVFVGRLSSLASYATHVLQPKDPRISELKDEIKNENEGLEKRKVLNVILYYFTNARA